MTDEIVIKALGTRDTDRGRANVLEVNGERVLCFPGAAAGEDTQTMYPTTRYPSDVREPFPSSLPKGPSLPDFLLGYEDRSTPRVYRFREGRWQLVAEIVPYNVDGRGEREHRLYPVSAAVDGYTTTGKAVLGFWPAVTDVACPVCEDGTVRWAEAGYVPGYRICDGCGRHFMAEGEAHSPALLDTGRVESSE